MAIKEYEYTPNQWVLMIIVFSWFLSLGKLCDLVCYCLGSNLLSVAVFFVLVASLPYLLWWLIGYIQYLFLDF